MNRKRQPSVRKSIYQGERTEIFMLRWRLWIKITQTIGLPPVRLLLLKPRRTAILFKRKKKNGEFKLQREQDAKRTDEKTGKANLETADSASRLHRFKNTPKM